MVMKLSRRNFLLFLAAAPVEALANTDESEPFLLSDPYELDLPKARLLIHSEFMRQFDDGLYMANLWIFTKVKPEAISFLSQYPCDFVFLGIDSLNLECAKALGTWKHAPFIDLSDLTHLQPDCANALCKQGSSLIFGGLRSLSTDTARELANSTNWLIFSRLHSISSNVAKALSSHESAIEMGLVVEPSTEAALYISQHKGHRFELDLSQPPSQSLITALSSNPNKTIRLSHSKRSGATDGHIWISSGGYEEVI